MAVQGKNRGDLSVWGDGLGGRGSSRGAVRMWEFWFLRLKIIGE